MMEHAPRTKPTLSGARAATLAGLVTGAVGIAILWVAGVEFPVYPPPGIVILLAGALLVSLAPWRWAPGVGALLGLFVVVGFVVSGGVPNLVGGDASSLSGSENAIPDDSAATILGSWIQLIGVLTALVAGAIATQRLKSRKAPA